MENAAASPEAYIAIHPSQCYTLSICSLCDLAAEQIRTIRRSWKGNMRKKGSEACQHIDQAELGHLLTTMWGLSVVWLKSWVKPLSLAPSKAD